METVLNRRVTYSNVHFNHIVVDNYKNMYPLKCNVKGTPLNPSLTPGARALPVSSSAYIPSLPKFCVHLFLTFFRVCLP